MEPFRENRYQRFLRTSAEPWQKKHWFVTCVAIFVIVIPGAFAFATLVGAWTDWPEGISPKPVFLVAVALFLYLHYQYKALERYDKYQAELSVESAKRRTHQMFNDMGIVPKKSFADGYDVVEGEVIPPEDS